MEYFKAYRNAENHNALEVVMPAVLKLLPETAPFSFENGQGGTTHYGIAKVAITKPDGTETTVDSTVWAKNLESKLYTVGSTVSIVVQLDGEYKGTSRLSLPPRETVDVDAMMSQIDMSDVETETVENATATTTTA